MLSNTSYKNFKKAGLWFLSRDFFILIVLAILAYQLAGITWKAVSPPLILNSKNSQELKFIPKKIDALPLPRLWGEPDVDVTKIPEPKKELVDITKMGYHYKGILRVGDNTLALISKGKRDEVYAVGDKVDTTTVVEITKEYVELALGESHGRIYFYPDTSYVKIITDQILSDQIRIIENEQLQEDEQAYEEVLDTNLDQSSDILETKEALQIKQDLMNHPLNIVEYISFQPEFSSDGTWKSVLINPRKHREIFTSLGFLPGDVILAVNGTSVGELARNPAVWQRMIMGSQASFEINRQGIQQTVEVDLSQ